MISSTQTNWPNQARATSALTFRPQLDAASHVVPWVACPYHHAMYLTESINLIFGYVPQGAQSKLHAHNYSLFGVALCDMPVLQERIFPPSDGSHPALSQFGMESNWHHTHNIKFGHCITNVVTDGGLSPFVHQVSPSSSAAAFVAVESPLPSPSENSRAPGIEVTPEDAVIKRWPDSIFSAAVTLRLAPSASVSVSPAQVSQQHRHVARLITPLPTPQQRDVNMQEAIDVQWDPQDGKIRTFHHRFPTVAMSATVIVPSLEKRTEALRTSVSNKRSTTAVEVVIGDIYAGAEETSPTPA